MKMQLRTKGIPITQALEAHIERRVRFALSRFGQKIRSVTVRLTDLNGPKGGEDIQCKILAYMTPGEGVIVNDRSEDPFTAVARASERIGHSISRRVRRMKARRKGRR